MSVEKIIRDTKIVPVLRHTNPTNIKMILEALYKGGIRAVEITAETEDFEHIVKIAKTEFEGRVKIGVGTILDDTTARIAILAGADFIVTPTLEIDVIKMARRYDVFVISGALTPTEVLRAFEQGSSIVKVFPAGVVGVDFIKALKGPLPHISLMATGNIEVNEAKNYIANGCTAVGLGGGLVDPRKISADDLTDLEKRTKELIEQIN